MTNLTIKNFIKSDFNINCRCEEYLECQSKNGIPYICLRLPDVIGPRDSTNRFWLLQVFHIILVKNCLKRCPL